MTKKSSASIADSRIEHYEYGLGTVLDVNERYTTIDFDEFGTKKFVTSIVKVTPSDTPAPTKPRRKKAAKSKAKSTKTTKAKAAKAKTTKTTKATKTTKKAKATKKTKATKKAKAE